MMKRFRINKPLVMMTSLAAAVALLAVAGTAVRPAWADGYGFCQSQSSLACLRCNTSKNAGSCEWDVSNHYEFGTCINGPSACDQHVFDCGLFLDKCQGGKGTPLYPCQDTVTCRNTLQYPLPKGDDPKNEP